MIRAFLDANVLVSTAIKPNGKSGQVFGRRVSEFEWLSSEYVIAEQDFRLSFRAEREISFCPARFLAKPLEMTTKRKPC